MILPQARDDAEWTRLREHDITELWDPSREPHTAAAYASRLGLLRSLVGRLTRPWPPSGKRRYIEADATRCR